MRWSGGRWGDRNGFLRRNGAFAEVASPVSLLDLSLVPQVVMHAASDEPVARRLQISGHTLSLTNWRCCAACWSRAAAGDFADPSSRNAVEKRAAHRSGQRDKPDDGHHLEAGQRQARVDQRYAVAASGVMETLSAVSTLCTVYSGSPEEVVAFVIHR